MHPTNWYMDQKAMDKNHLDKTYIALNEMWTENNGTNHVDMGAKS